MSIAGAKTQLQAALQTITWTVPASAVPLMSGKTAFGRVDTQHYISEGPIQLPLSSFPLCRIALPDVDEHRKTDGSDAASRKEQRIVASLWIYQFGQEKDWQALGDFFDVVLDGTLAYFRRNSAPQPGPVTAGNNDHITAWGLHQRARPETPESVEGTLHLRATVLVDLIMTIV